MIRRRSQSSTTTTSTPAKPRVGIRKRSNGLRKAAAPLKPRIPPLGTPVGKKIGSGDYRGFYRVGFADRPKGQRHPFFRDILMPHQLRLSTYYIIDYKHTKFVAMETVQPDGCLVAWDTCRRCHRHIGNCVCQEIKPPDYILNWVPKKSIQETFESESKPKRTIKKIDGRGKKLIRKKVVKS